MFDFFKWAAEETFGGKTEKREKERREQNLIFTRGYRLMVIVLAVFYVMLSVFIISWLLSDLQNNLLWILMYCVQAVLAVFVMISLLVKSKKWDMVALVGIAIFVAILMLSI